MSLAEPRGCRGDIRPASAVTRAADLGCTSPSLSIPSPVLPTLSSSPLENDPTSPTEPPAVPELQPPLPGPPAGTSSGTSIPLRSPPRHGRSLAATGVWGLVEVRGHS